MAFRIKDADVSVGYPLSSSSRRGEEWKSFQFNFHDFAKLRTTKDHYVTSPKFTCNGHLWQLKIYPGGSNDSNAAEGKVSVYLTHLTEKAITTRYDLMIVDKFGKAKKTVTSKKQVFTANYGWGFPDFFSRSDILDESKNIMDDNGTLAVVVSIEEEPTTAFVPKNPFLKLMQEMLYDETSADVCFEVSAEDEGAPFQSSVPVYAHRVILEKCAPMLAAICGSNNDSGGVVTASVNDIEPEIFEHLLFYVYGGRISEFDLKLDAKDIIAAADKYSIVNLKLEAEAAYVESTDISLDNAMDNLLYADSMNLALLKEAVMNFLAENEFEAAAHIDFTNFPANVVKDLLIAFGKSKKKEAGNGSKVDELATLSVSALRRKLDWMGLDVDGSREAMIESIKSVWF